MSVRSYVGVHKVAVSLVAALALGLLIFAVLWFEPQKLVQEKTVREAAPVTSTSPSPSSTAEPATGTVASGRFRSLEHETTGGAKLIRLADGSHVLRFEDLDTSNGPDLRVYLSELPSTLGWRDYGERYLELGELKGNRGDQNYELPETVDLSKYRAVTVWCRRFSVNFATAPLAAI